MLMQVCGYFLTLLLGRAFSVRFAFDPPVALIPPAQVQVLRYSYNVLVSAGIFADFDPRGVQGLQYRRYEVRQVVGLTLHLPRGLAVKEVTDDHRDYPTKHN